MRSKHFSLLLASIAGVFLSCQFPAALAQIQIPYGSDPMQYGELTIPEGDGPFPIVTFLHAGCWRSSERMIGAYQAMAAEIATHGVAAWNMQYRGATSPGGGWPGTWLDIANGFDALEECPTTTT